MSRELVLIFMSLSLTFAHGSKNMAPLQDGTVPGALSMHATIENVGIVSPYSGDDNQNNNASVWYRVTGTSTWLAGPELYADRSAREWRGSLLYLLSGTPYDVEVRYSDPDGVAPATVSGTISTRPNYPDVGSGGRILYVPDSGDLQTVIQAAMPGDTIRLRAGTYYTTVLLSAQNSGTPGHYLTIEADPGAQVILDGSDPELNNPAVNNWTLYEGNVYYTDLSWGDKVCSDTILPGYVGEQRGGDGMRYLLYYSSGATDWNDFLAAPPGKAFYDCGSSHPGRLYVATYEGDDPNQHVIYASRYPYGLYLKGASYVRIRGFEFRYYGLVGLQLGGPSADNNVVEENTFHGIGQYHLFIGEWSHPSSADNLIQYNKFYEKGYRDSGWTWTEMYRHANTNAIQTAYALPGNVIQRNVVQGGTDGINVHWQSSDTDVYANVTDEMMDEGIGVDNVPGYNIRVWSNLIQHYYSGISNQDWSRSTYTGTTGPVYIFRNVLTGGKDPQGRSDHTGGTEGYDTWYAFKVGSNIPGPGRAYLYHNTIYVPDAPIVGDGVQDGGGPYFPGMIARNNIWAVRGRVFEFCCSTDASGHDLDFDNLYHAGSSPSSRLIQWTDHGGPKGNGAYQNLADFQRYVSQEMHAISNSNTRFNPDFSLGLGSPEIDAGTVITGFNDHGEWAYTGLRPDIGAFEYSDAQGLNDSTKVASAGGVAPGDNLTYTIRVVRANMPLTANAIVTDTLPAGADYVDGTLTATLGVASLISNSTMILWEGDLSDDRVAEIRYAVRVTVSETTVLKNTAWIDEGFGQTISRSGVAIVNGLPAYLPIVLRQ